MKIPLFPLHTVLCPGIVVPLHIFEERYREMTRRCLDTGEPFGVVLIREGREVGSRSISTLAGVGAFLAARDFLPVDSKPHRRQRRHQRHRQQYQREKKHPEELSHCPRL